MEYYVFLHKNELQELQKIYPELREGDIMPNLGAKIKLNTKIELEVKDV